MSQKMHIFDFSPADSDCHPIATFFGRRHKRCKCRNQKRRHHKKPKAEKKARREREYFTEDENDFERSAAIEGSSFLFGDVLLLPECAAFQRRIALANFF